MELSLLFESFMVFYLLEVMVLVAIFKWYYKDNSKNIQAETVTKAAPAGPTASQIIKMRQLAAQMEREKA